MDLSGYGETVELPKDITCEVAAPAKAHHKVQWRAVILTPTPDSSILAEVCVCVCVYKREREGGRERKREKKERFSVLII